jgi:hypothetical protein
LWPIKNKALFFCGLRINNISANNRSSADDTIRNSGKQLMSVYMGNCNLIVINISDTVNHFHYRKWQKHYIYEI